MAPTHHQSNQVEAMPFVNGGSIREKVRVERIEVPVALRSEVVKEVRVPHIVETVKYEQVKVPVLDHSLAKGLQKSLDALRDEVRGITPQSLPDIPKAGFNPSWLAVAAVVLDIAVRFVS